MKTHTFITIVPFHKPERGLNKLLGLIGKECLRVVAYTEWELIGYLEHYPSFMLCTQGIRTYGPMDIYLEDYPQIRES